MDTTAQAQQMLADIANNGGGTYTQRDLEPYRPIAGYIVAIGGAILPAKDVTAESIVLVAKAVAGEHMTDLVGTWLDDGKVYIDAVRHIRDRVGAERIGREFGQIAIYDLAADEAIVLTDEDGEYPLRSN